MSTTVAISDRDGAMSRTLKSFYNSLIRVISHSANEAPSYPGGSICDAMGNNQVKVLYAGQLGGR